MDKKKTRDDALTAAVRSGFGRDEDPDGAKGGDSGGANAALSEEFDDFPETCDETRIVLLPVSPFRVHAYWVIGSADLDRPERRIGADNAPLEAVLRLQEMADAETEGESGLDPVDVRIVQGAGSTYFEPCRPGMLYVAHLELIGGDGRFLALSRSNVVRAPFAAPAPLGEETPRPVAREHGTEEAPAAEEGMGAVEPSPRATRPSVPALTDVIPTMGRSEKAECDVAAKEQGEARAEAKDEVPAWGATGGAGPPAETEDSSEGEKSRVSPGVASTSLHPGPEELRSVQQAAQVPAPTQLGPYGEDELTTPSLETPVAEPPTIRWGERPPDLTELTEKAFLYGVSSEQAAKE
jgi:hypothetical protein